MRLSKRRLLIICAALLASLLLAGSASALTYKDGQFTDVHENSTYYKAVAWAFNNGITDGLTSTTFGPTGTCTRGQVVTFLWRAAGCPEPSSNNNPFKDVSANDYFCNAVLWAVEKGITDGTSADTFSPAAKCTNAHVITFLWRAKGKPEARPSENYIAKNNPGKFYTEAASWGEGNQIIDRVYDFVPGDPAPRSSIVSYMYNCEGRPDVEIIPAEGSNLPVPQNVRITAYNTQTGTAYIQWDEVPGIEFYYVVVSNGNEYYYLSHEESGDPIAFRHADGYSAMISAPSSRFGVNVVSVKEFEESEPSKILMIPSSNRNETAVNAIKKLGEEIISKGAKIYHYESETVYYEIGYENDYSTVFARAYGDSQVSLGFISDRDLDYGQTEIFLSSADPDTLSMEVLSSWVELAGDTAPASGYMSECKLDPLIAVSYEGLYYPKQGEVKKLLALLNDVYQPSYMKDFICQNPDNMTQRDAELMTAIQIQEILNTLDTLFKSNNISLTPSDLGFVFY